MVAAATHMPVHEIEWNLPLAQGLQYEAIWLEMQGNITRSTMAAQFDADKWKEIAGL